MGDSGSQPSFQRVGGSRERVEEVDGPPRMRDGFLHDRRYEHVLIHCSRCMLLHEGVLLLLQCTAPAASVQDKFADVRDSLPEGRPGGDGRQQGAHGSTGRHQLDAR